MEDKSEFIMAFTGTSYAMHVVDSFLVPMQNKCADLGIKYVAIEYVSE
jgi:hypothetical protein